MERSAYNCVLAEIVADPISRYTMKQLMELTGYTYNPVKSALDRLEGQKLVRNISRNGRPLYEILKGSKRLLALTFLAHAVNDDRDDTCCIDMAVADYLGIGKESMGRTVAWTGDFNGMVSGTSYTIMTTKPATGSRAHTSNGVISKGVLA